MPYDVFISYASQDSCVANKACETLEAAGLRCWIAPRNVRAGIPYSDSILEGVYSARAMILVFSAAADNSPHVLREVECAVSHRIPVLPLQVEDLPNRGHL